MSTRTDPMMSSHKIKTDALARMARTGEPYVVARRAVIRERQEAESRAGAGKLTEQAAFEAVAADLARMPRDVWERVTYPVGIAEIERRFAAQFAQAGRVVRAQQDAAAQVVRAAQASGVMRAHQQVAAQVAQFAQAGRVVRAQQDAAAQVVRAAQAS